MADAELPAPQTSPAPQVPQGLQAPQPPICPNQPYPKQPIQHMPQLNWSHFKPEFTRKSEANAEAHLLRKND